MKTAMHHPAVSIEALAIATILKDMTGVAPTAALIHAMAPVMDQAELDLGYAFLLNPAITAAEARQEFTVLLLDGSHTVFGNSPIPIPTFAQDVVAAELVGVHGLHFSF